MQYVSSHDHCLVVFFPNAQISVNLFKFSDSQNISKTLTEVASGSSQKASFIWPSYFFIFFSWMLYFLFDHGIHAIVNGSQLFFHFKLSSWSCLLSSLFHVFRTIFWPPNIRNHTFRTAAFFVEVLAIALFIMTPPSQPLADYLKVTDFLPLHSNFANVLQT